MGEPDLEVGQASEGVLAPDGRRSYRFQLAAGDYVRLRVTPAAVERVTEISAAVVAPAERSMLDAERIRSADGGVFAWIAPVEGRYRVDLSNPDPTSVTPFSIVLEEVRPERPGDRHRAAAETARAEAWRRMDLGEQEAALDAWTRALEEWRRIGETGAVLESQLEIATLRSSADAQGALADYAEVLEQSADLPEWEVEALDRTGRLLKRLGDCAGAEEAFERAKALALARGDRHMAGDLAYNLGSLHKRCSQDDRKRSSFEEALDLARRAEHLALQGLVYREFALLAKLDGDLGAAREQIEIALGIAEAAGDRQVLADVLHEAGNIDRNAGRLAEAREHFRRCLDLNEALGNWSRVGPTLRSLGSIALDLRRPEEAREYSLRALELARARNDLEQVAEAEREVGAGSERLGEALEAEAAYRRSWTTARQIADDRLVAQALSRLGNLLRGQQRAEEAIELLGDALERQRAIGDERALALTLRAMGAALAETGERGRAGELLTEALDLERRQGDKLGTVWALYELARLQSTRDPELARRTIEEAIAISRAVREGLAVDALRAEFSEAPKALYDLYVDLLVEAGDVAGAFVANEEGRAQALLGLLAEARIDARLGVDPDLDLQARELDERIAWLQHQLRDAVGRRASDGRAQLLRNQLDEALQDGWRLEAEIRRRSPRYRELKTPAVLTLEQVRAMLPPRGALLEYWLGAERSYLFSVTAAGTAIHPLPPERELRTRIERLREAVISRRPPGAVAEAGFPLYRDLVAPALDLGGEVSELIIVPDGPLHLLPFETLVTAPSDSVSRFDQVQFLIHQAAISYAPSATVLSSLRDRPPSGPVPPRHGLRFLAFADPDYDGALPVVCPEPGGAAAGDGDGPPERAPELTRLGGARQEVQRIAKRYGRAAKVYEGSSATEERVRTSTELASAERIHFAVHGVMCESRPERSGLVLSLDDGAAEDGILEAREVFGLQLNPDLVVLSACDTGVGKLVRGEGVVGLSRAFFFAGAPSLVVSLWQVPDRSTADLMSAFYQGLDRGASKADALRSAKLGLIEAGGVRAGPYYWAPFVLMGSRGAER